MSGPDSSHPLDNDVLIRHPDVPYPLQNPSSVSTRPHDNPHEAPSTLKLTLDHVLLKYDVLKFFIARCIYLAYPLYSPPSSLPQQWATEHLRKSIRSFGQYRGTYSYYVGVTYCKHSRLPILCERPAGEMSTRLPEERQMNRG